MWWWWDFNPENIYAFHEQEDIKLIWTKINQNFLRGSLFKGVDTQWDDKKFSQEIHFLFLSVYFNLISFCSQKDKRVQDWNITNNPPPLIFCFSTCLLLLLLCLPGKRLWCWDSKPEHVYDFHEREYIKLIKAERKQKKLPRDSLF